MQGVCEGFRTSDGQHAAKVLCIRWRHRWRHRGANVVVTVGARICGAAAFDWVGIIAKLAAGIAASAPIAKATSLPTIDPAIFVFVLHWNLRHWRLNLNTFVLFGTAEATGIKTLSGISGLSLPAAGIPHAAPVAVAPARAAVAPQSCCLRRSGSEALALGHSRVWPSRYRSRAAKMKVESASPSSACRTSRVLPGAKLKPTA